MASRRLEGFFRRGTVIVCDACHVRFWRMNKGLIIICRPTREIFLLHGSRSFEIWVIATVLRMVLSMKCTRWGYQPMRFDLADTLLGANTLISL
jgi:hypothetical protein